VKRSQTNPNGGRVDFDAPIHISNVRACDEEGRPLKLKMRTTEQGVRELVYLKDGQPVVWRSLKRSMK
jgi:large subunit ribosomal protein L24